MRAEALKGHLDFLLLAIVADEPAHGYRIIEELKRRSGGAFDLPEGTVYPALHRLIKRGWIAAEDGASENNRRAKFYRLTPKGRKQLAVETTKWDKLARAIAGILRPAGGEGKS